MDTTTLKTQTEIVDFFSGKTDCNGKNSFFSVKGSKHWIHRIFRVYPSDETLAEGWFFIVGQKDIAKEGVIVLEKELSAAENVYKIKISEITEIVLEKINN